MKLLAIALSVFSISTIFASTERKSITYSIGETTFVSTIIYPTDSDKPLPGLLMVPNWMGPTEAAMEKAEAIAEDDYVIMVVDMYGTEVRPKNGNEAGQAAGLVRGDRPLMRARAQTALDKFLEQADAVNLAKDKIAAIGFCFGGGTVLELGRSGANLDAIVTFHGDLVSPTLEADAGKTKAKVLVLHGADDPYVPQADVQQFISVMQKTDVDWQLVQYSGTVHSFTNPDADSDGSRFNRTSSYRAFEAMEELLEEIWDN